MTPPIRLRRRTDRGVAVSLGGDWYVVIRRRIGNVLPDTYVRSGMPDNPGWVELFVAELPNPDGWLDAVGDAGQEARTPFWNSELGSSVTAWIDGVEDDAGLTEDLLALRADALKTLAAVAACEQYRADGEGKTK